MKDLKEVLDSEEFIAILLIMSISFAGISMITVLDTYARSGVWNITVASIGILSVIGICYGLRKMEHFPETCYQNFCKKAFGKMIQFEGLSGEFCGIINGDYLVMGLFDRSGCILELNPDAFIRGTTHSKYKSYRLIRKSQTTQIKLIDNGDYSRSN